MRVNLTERFAKSATTEGRRSPIYYDDEVIGFGLQVGGMLRNRRCTVRAHAIRDRLFQNENLTVEEVAREANLVPSYVTRLLRLTFLAPDIVTSIIAGRQPVELTARKLMADTRLPLDWSEQRIQLGFA